MKSSTRFSSRFLLALLVVQFAFGKEADRSEAQECLFGAHRGIGKAHPETVSVTIRFFPSAFQQRRLSAKGARLGNLFGEDLIAMSTHHVAKRISESLLKVGEDSDNLKRVLLARRETPNALILKTKTSILVMPHVFLLVDQVRNYKLRDGDFVGTMMIRRGKNDTEALSKLNPHFWKTDENVASSGFTITRRGIILPTQLRGTATVKKSEQTTIELLDQIDICIEDIPEALKDSLEMLTPVCIVTRRIPGIAMPVRYVSPVKEFGAFSILDPKNLGWCFRALIPELRPEDARYPWKEMFYDFQDFNLFPLDEVELTVLEMLPELSAI